MAEGNLVGVVDRIQRLLECLDLKDITEKQRLDEIKKDFSMLRGSFDDAELKKKLYSDKLLLKDSLADVDDLLTKMLALTWRTRHVSAPKKLIMMMKMMMNTTTAFFNSISSKMDNAMQIVKQLQNSSVPEAEAEEEQRGNVGGEIIVVGRDHHLAQITEKLLKKDDDDVEDKNLMVIPIVGIGGVGKTIIAMLICDDQMVKSHFDLTIWVSLGVAFDVKAIMKQIISFITHNYPTISDFKELQALVFSEIRRKRFLLVLDDVPPNVDEHSWKEDSIDDATLVRHVSFDFHLDSSWQISIPSSDLKRIRSLFLPWQYQRAIEGGSSQSICDVIPKFEWLRMLDLHNTGIKKLPDSISELKLLCNLDLSQNGDIKALPKSICGLYFLQTLKLNHCSNLQTLPRGITRLFNLRHLENKSCHCLTQVPRGLSQLSNLRTLSEFGLSKDNPSKPNGKLDELSCLNYLRGEIKIKNLRNPKDDKTAAANMKGKKEVLSLILIWDINSSVNEADCEEALEDLEPHPNLRELSISTYGGSKFSSWLPLLKNLVKLSISRCNRCHCLPRLDQLTNLQVLVVDELMKHHHQQQHEELLVLKNTSWKPFKRTVTTAIEEKRALTSQLEVSSSSPSSTLTKSKSRRSPRRTKSLNMKPKSPSFKKVSRPKPVSSTVALDSTLKTPVPAPQNISSTTTVTPLSKLRTLHIIDMPNSDPNMWKSLHSLRSVTLDNVADINDYLKGGLRQVTSLQQLHILRCYNLVEIETWIDDFKTLSKISIKLCPQLRIPHDRIDLITSSNVKVEHCPRVTHIERSISPSG
ncbi:hypothetical protein G4B88_025703 [Cannabis sativa]|uniref:Uncharacterized protein n=1 Tax=Cannabis sativa TaxID=3483 RepID=A0A7J6F487_CANSA|nr:hypothetical protein G4B88_025703 [Cannabis sativa]